MKIKTLIAGIILATGSSVAYADNFYLDTGTGNGDDARNKVAGVTTTGSFSQASYNYQSTTVVTDLGVDGPGVGDLISTSGGFGQAGGRAANAVNGFIPNAFGGESYNGYGSTWGLTFDFELMGTFGPSFQTNYTSGFVTFYYFEGAGPLTELFTLDYKSITQSPGGPSLKTQLSAVAAGVVNGVAAGEVLNIIGAGSAASLLADDIDTYAFIDFNTDPLSVSSFTNLGGGMYSVSGDHDGSISFVVPEPASVAILGLGLLGLAGAGRRRKS